MNQSQEFEINQQKLLINQNDINQMLIEHDQNEITIQEKELQGDREDFEKIDKDRQLQEKYILQLKRIIESTNYRLDQLSHQLHKNKEEQNQQQSKIQEIINNHQMILKERNQNQQTMKFFREQHQDIHAQQDNIIDMIGRLQKEQLQYESELMKHQMKNCPKEEQKQTFNDYLEEENQIQLNNGDLFTNSQYFGYQQQNNQDRIQDSSLSLKNLKLIKDQIQMDIQEQSNDMQAIQSNMEDESKFYLEAVQQTKNQKQQQSHMNEFTDQSWYKQILIIYQRDNVAKQSQINQKLKQLQNLNDEIERIIQQSTLEEIYDSQNNNRIQLYENVLKMPSDQIIRLIKSNKAKIDQCYYNQQRSKQMLKELIKRSKNIKQLSIIKIEIWKETNKVQQIYINN